MPKPQKTGEERVSRFGRFPRQTACSEAYLIGNPYHSVVEAMSAAFARASVKCENGPKDIFRASIVTSVFFTTLPAEILLDVDASSESLKAKMELEAGRIVEALIYSITISTQGREKLTLAATYEGAPPVLGANFLEDFGPKVDSETGSLKPTSQKGLAYDFES